MKNRKTPTVSQYSYITTNLLTAKASRGENITEDDVKAAIKTAQFTLSLIYELTDTDPDEEAPTQEDSIELDYFAEYPWNGEATYTELTKWLHSKGVTSNRRISNILKESLEKGYIHRNGFSRKYYRHEVD